ncbi:MAG: LolA family protein [Mangrovibacterium sp.]
MKKLSILLFLCIASFGIKAQTAGEIINKVTEQIKNYKSIQLDFDYTMLNDEMGINESNKGNLAFKSEKYILNLNQLGISIYCDGTSSYTYNSEANELTISSLEDGDQMMNPAALFSMYEKGFDGKYLGEENIDGISCYKLEMTPQAGNQVEFAKAEVFINKKNNFIQQARMYVDGGTVYTLNIKNVHTDLPIDDAQFVFDKAAHPGVEVTDLR